MQELVHRVWGVSERPQREARRLRVPCKLVGDNGEVGLERAVGPRRVTVVVRGVADVGEWSGNPRRLAIARLRNQRRRGSAVTPSVLHPKLFTKTCHEHHVCVSMHAIECIDKFLVT